MMMLAALAFTTLMQAAAPIDAVIVKDGTRETSVPVTMLSDAPMVRIDQVAVALGGEVRSLGNDRFRLDVAGSSLELSAWVAFARTGEMTVPLAQEPVMHDGRLYVPYALLTEVLPRLVPGLRFDSARATLHVVRGTKGASAPAAAAAPARRLQRLVIVDAGHGGRDPGTSGPLRGKFRIVEKDIALQIARALKTALEARDVRVYMTRNSDTLIALRDRGRIANEHKGDAFISIHVNAANPRWKSAASARGVETYFLAEARTEDARHVEAMENEVVKYEVGNTLAEDDPLGFIVHDMEQNQYLRESSDFAAAVQRRLAGAHPGPNRGVKQAEFVVLYSAIMPAILVETGFGSNVAEATWLRSRAGQKSIAEAVADATVQYLDAYEKRLSAGAP
ncbi:MAG TPA: N-acetylmuramoyl-L-alanine amidase [Gemmatimonadaceae bacterium]|nr:N-acetylmuramoyl-L-alanine amidase [Gemmatimonadaceae bacterium]